MEDEDSSTVVWTAETAALKAAVDDSEDDDDELSTLFEDQVQVCGLKVEEAELDDSDSVDSVGAAQVGMETEAEAEDDDDDEDSGADQASEDELETTDQAD